MAKQDKVNIRLELIKDKSYGNFTIVAHFDSKAPNVLVDKNEYIWMPTLEEKELLNDAFDFLSTKPTLKQAVAKETNTKLSLPEKIPSEEPLYEKIPQKYTKPEEKPEELPTLEKEEEEEEPNIFEATEKKTTSGYKDAEQNREEPMDAKADITSGESEEKIYAEEKKDEDEGIIVEADAETIEAALKKHAVKDDEDSNLVEADEQTIIDKVLSQKKKGKWSRK